VARSKQSTGVADLVCKSSWTTTRKRLRQAAHRAEQIGPAVDTSHIPAYDSAYFGQDRRGLDDLRRAIVAELTGRSAAPLRDRPSITNVRHIALVQRAHDALERARAAASAAGGALSEEFVLPTCRRRARRSRRSRDGVRPTTCSRTSFERFCIGNESRRREQARQNGARPSTALTLDRRLSTLDGWTTC
jgi:hypothetical protein